MSYFGSTEEVDRYIGGVLRAAAGHPRVGPVLEAGRVTLRLLLQEPDCELTVEFHAPMTVSSGCCPLTPDVTLSLPADIADKFWRGEYDLLAGLAGGDVRAKGPVSKVLKLLPAMQNLFPFYRGSVADKDALCA